MDRRSLEPTNTEANTEVRLGSPYGHTSRLWRSPKGSGDIIAGEQQVRTGFVMKRVIKVKSIPIPSLFLRTIR